MWIFTRYEAVLVPELGGWRLHYGPGSHSKHFPTEATARDWAAKNDIKQVEVRP